MTLKRKTLIGLKKQNPEHVSFGRGWKARTNHAEDGSQRGSGVRDLHSGQSRTQGWMRQSRPMGTPCKDKGHVRFAIRLRPQWRESTADRSGKTVGAPTSTASRVRRAPAGLSASPAGEGKRKGRSRGSGCVSHKAAVAALCRALYTRITEDTAFRGSAHGIFITTDSIWIGPRRKS